MTWPRHAAVLGASGLLGTALTEALAAKSDRLSLAGLEDDDLAVLAAKVKAGQGIDATSEVIDIRDPSTVARWLKDRNREQRIDWLVVNAGLTGIAEEDAFLEAPARCTDLVETNLLGPIHALETALPLMQGQGGGRIILVSSLSALLGYSQAPVYAATKAGLRALTYSLRPTARQGGIELTLACPGFLARPPAPGVATSRPFQVEPRIAAGRILKAAAAGRAEVLFPRRLVFLLRLLSLLPVRHRERFL